jgi:hypothetical protein
MSIEFQKNLELALNNGKSESFNNNRSFLKDLENNTTKEFYVVSFKYHPVHNKSMVYDNFTFHSIDISRTEDSLKLSHQLPEDFHPFYLLGTDRLVLELKSKNMVDIYADNLSVYINYYRCDNNRDFSFTIDSTDIRLMCTGTYLSSYTTMGKCIAKCKTNKIDTKDSRCYVQDLILSSDIRVRDIHVIIDPNRNILPYVVQRITDTKDE